MGRSHTNTLLQFVASKERVEKDNIPMKSNFVTTNKNTQQKKIQDSNIQNNEKRTNMFEQQSEPECIVQYKPE